MGTVERSGMEGSGMKQSGVESGVTDFAPSPLLEA